jgi:hypothetical protein
MAKKPKKRVRPEDKAERVQEFVDAECARLNKQRSWSPFDQGYLAALLQVSNKLEEA